MEFTIIKSRPISISFASSSSYFPYPIFQQKSFNLIQFNLMLLFFNSKRSRNTHIRSLRLVMATAIRFHRQTDLPTHKI
ncbi:hypothetical protein CXB51_002511 [Gossypium anomalum]|uniref:Uncharacterized protein n=1 Tax=Gossypium anomalum TaxID=47600 RepID=A0A8J5ZC22_9ROSI|nr:hypothetical protein CXB51_002511 [Gossypium anomalum]